MHKSQVTVTTTTLSKREVEVAILDYAKIGSAKSVTIESDGRATIIEQTFPAEPQEPEATK